MIYLDNAATGGRKPDNVLTAVNGAVKLCANPGRSGHKLSLSCAKLVQDCRNALSDYFDGYGYERVIFTKNCTEALNVALFGCLKSGDHVVTTCMEHNSVLRALEQLKRGRGIDYDVCPLTEENGLDPSFIAYMVRPNTKIVAVTAASNVTGYTPNLRKIRSLLPENVLFFVDGAQGAGHFPLKMREIGIDALALAGHKGVMGIQGSGALIFSDRLNPAPLLYGGTGSDSLSLSMPDFYPDALEAGTLCYPAVVSLFEGIAYLRAHEAEDGALMLRYTKRLLDGLEKMPSYKAYSKENPCGIVSFEHREISSEEIAERLSNDYNVAVRGGFHCAPEIHRALKTEENGLIRASFSPFNQTKEIDLLLSALRELS